MDETKEAQLNMERVADSWIIEQQFKLKWYENLVKSTKLQQNSQIQQRPTFRRKNV